jgi:hypothetical protein
VFEDIITDIRLGKNSKVSIICLNLKTNFISISKNQD